MNSSSNSVRILFRSAQKSDATERDSFGIVVMSDEVAEALKQQPCLVDELVRVEAFGREIENLRRAVSPAPAPEPKTFTVGNTVS